MTTKPPKITSRPDFRQPAVIPIDARHVPAWWVDEFPTRTRLIASGNGYDCFQSASDAECGAVAAWHLLRPYLRRI